MININISLYIFDQILKDLPSWKGKWCIHFETERAKTSQDLTSWKEKCVFIFYGKKMCVYFFRLLRSTTLMSTTCTHTHPYEHTYTTLPQWAPQKDYARGSRDSRSHHMRLAVDRNVAYHKKHSAVKSWNKSKKIRVPVPSRELEPEWSGSAKKSNHDQFANVCLFWDWEQTPSQPNFAWVRTGLPLVERTFGALGPRHGLR